MKWFLPSFLVALWLPHLPNGDGRWLILGLFIGLVCLMLRGIET